MDNFFEIVLAGIFGEALFRKIAKKKYFPITLFSVLTIAVQILISVFFLILSIPSLFEGGYYHYLPLSHFFLSYLESAFITSQPYALLLSMSIAILGVLSYLWHRKYSHNEKQ